MTTTHAIASASPGGVSHPASLGETVEWFDAKGRSETGLPDYLDIDFRVWQDGRSGIYLTANQREVLAPTGVLFWTLKNGRLVFAARYRPAQSIASQTHGVVRLNDRNLASIQNKELSSLVRGMRVVRGDPPGQGDHSRCRRPSAIPCRFQYHPCRSRCQPC